MRWHFARLNFRATNHSSTISKNHSRSCKMGGVYQLLESVYAGPILRWVLFRLPRWPDRASSGERRRITIFTNSGIDRVRCRAGLGLFLRILEHLQFSSYLFGNRIELLWVPWQRGQGEFQLLLGKLHVT